MDRRRFLAAASSLGGALGLSGCLSVVFDGPETSPPVGSGWRPDAVYIPEHASAMAMLGRERQGRYEVAFSYTFPHSFWLMSGGAPDFVGPQPADTLHLMLRVWDRQTGTLLAPTAPTVTLQRDGTRVTRTSLWRMLSQQMGPHYGENVQLGAEGRYTVETSLGGRDTRLTGALTALGGETPTFSVSFDLTDALFDAIQQSTDRWNAGVRAGDRDALEPMEMPDVPTGQVPPPADLPGRSIGQGMADDARIAVTVLSDPPAGVDGDGPYLVCSPRTPYNRYPLTLMSVAARVDPPAGDTIQKPLTASIHPEFGYHYGATVPAVPAGTEVTIGVESPPAIARHEGYERAFLDMPPVTVTA